MKAYTEENIVPDIIAVIACAGSIADHLATEPEPDAVGAAHALYDMCVRLHESYLDDHTPEEGVRLIIDKLNDKAIEAN